MEEIKNNDLLEVWDNIFLMHDWGKYPEGNLIRFVANNFYQKNRSDINLLEIGCGPGANIWYMANEGFNVSGIDGSPTAIQKATDRLKKENLMADLRVGNVINLPFDSNTFDAVVDCQCLYCNNKSTTIKIMENIHRVLKPDGLLFSRTFTDKMYIGEHHKKIAHNEYTDISDGPLEGKGFVRLIDKSSIQEIYGKFFDIKSIDLEEKTYNNGKYFISEWVIVCKKIR